ncbi:MAG: hypothetical protein ACTS4T_01745 [Candidatus Hodgkinia cicadicola]
MFRPSSVEASEEPCNSTEVAFHLSTIQRSINLRPSAGANLRRAEVLTSTQFFTSCDTVRTTIAAPSFLRVVNPWERLQHERFPSAAFTTAMHHPLPLTGGRLYRITVSHVLVHWL